MVALAALSPSSSLLPVPSDKCKEVPLRSALRNSPVADLVEATAREIDKQRGFGALGADIAGSDLPAGAIVVDGHVLYKHKHDGRDTCRIAAMGDRLPVLPSEQTYASVVSDGAKGFAIAAMQAHCKARGEELLISDADVVGGFLHIPLNAPVPMYLRLPTNLPHPLAGRLLEIHHAIYGLRESNRLFNLEMTRVLLDDAGFSATVDPQLFVRSAVDDPGVKCVVSVTVDDLLILTNSIALRTLVLDALTARFGQLTVNLVTSIHTDIEFARSPAGAVILTQDKAITRAASVVGVAHMPAVSIPADSDFFAFVLRVRKLYLSLLRCMRPSLASWSNFSRLVMMFAFWYPIYVPSISPPVKGIIVELFMSCVIYTLLLVWDVSMTPQSWNW